ncbi:MAG TPA: Uma2 family endonuclease [Terriglobia bacterium]|nr:Uma2 family endonuclease [Terriglobia bacterium]
MATATTRLTYRDLQQIPQDRNRYELIEGELFVAPAPNVEHQRKVGRLFIRLAQHVEQHDLGEVFIAPCDVLLDDSTVLEPDIVYVSKARHSIVTHRCIEGAPDLVVEVLSDSSRTIDRFVKRDRYAEFGVPEYWLLDPFEPRIEVLQLEGRRYRLAGSFGPTGTLDASRTFPELRIPLSSL